jgi:hypothetical protein
MVQAPKPKSSQKAFGHAISDQEKEDFFREQRAAMESSCREFDSGYRWEAKRLATSAYVFCHDPTNKGSRSKSLLRQLGLKHKLAFLSTIGNLPETRIPWIPLTYMKATETTTFEFMPKLDSAPTEWQWLSFADWWEQPIFRTPWDNKLSRKTLVHSMRSQDGGSHADDAIEDDAYAAMRQFNDSRVLRSKPGVPGKPKLMFILDPKKATTSKDIENFEPIPGAHFATMRQIAFELLTSIGRMLWLPRSIHQPILIPKSDVHTENPDRGRP